MSGGAREVFRSRFSRILAVGVWLLCALGAWGSIVSGPHGLSYLPPITFVAYAAWLGLWHPRVEVTADAVRLVNVLSTITVPWAALIQIETKYALTLRTPHGSFAAYAAPAPGRTGALMSRREGAVPRDTSVVVGGRVQPSDLLTSDSGAAAHLVRTRWAELRDADAIEIGVADETRVARHWHVAHLAIAGALLVGSLALLAYR